MFDLQSVSQKNANDSALPPRAGISLKARHVPHILDERPEIGWFEAHPENYMGDGGPPHAQLAAIRADYPLSLHGVGLSLGGSEPLDKAHLQRLRALIERYQPQSFSEHLAWSTHQGQYLNDLLALPLNAETLQLVCDHVDETQEALGVRLLLENPSTYLGFEQSELDEADFLAAVARRSGCGLLLDVNNVYVSSRNQGLDPAEVLRRFPHVLVGEIHLAGHTEERDEAGDLILIDTHDQAVRDEVWQLYELAVSLTGPVPVLIERDGNIPALEVLMAEMARADEALRAARERQTPLEALA